MYSRRFVWIRPLRTITTCLLAKPLQRVDRRKEAIAEYREAVRVAPSEADWHNNLGAALLEDDQLPEAAHEFSESIRCNPSCPMPIAISGLADGAKGYRGIG